MLTPITHSSLVFLEKLEVINKLWFINKLLMVKTKTETFNLLILFMEFLIWWGLNNMKLGNRLYIYRSSHPVLFLRKGVLKICSKFTEHPCRSAICKAKQLYWNHTSAWVFSCKFAAYFRKLNRLEIYIFWAFWSKILWYGRNSLWVHSGFPSGKCFSQFNDKF